MQSGLCLLITTTQVTNSALNLHDIASNTTIIRYEERQQANQRTKHTRRTLWVQTNLSES
jgi:hypothetical protein